MKKQSISFLVLIVFITVTACKQKPVDLYAGFENETYLANNQKDIYSVELEKGSLLEMTLIQKGADIVIDTYDPSGVKLQSFDSGGTSGPEQCRIEAKTSGKYRLEVYPFIAYISESVESNNKKRKKNTSNYAIISVKILTEKECRQKLDLKRENAPQVISWIESNAIPVNSVNAGSDFEDLQPLKQILMDVRYVGLGEATHSTREFFQMKHRMLEFLVKEMGFTIFAIESSFGGCKNINDYVLYGKGDAHTALASQGFWIWDTEEVIEMIEWMRTYNLSVPEDKKVKFTGFDIQQNYKGGGISVIESYLNKVDSVRFHEMKPLLDSIDLALNVKNKDSVMFAYKNFFSFFVMSKGIYVQKSSEEEYNTVLEYCRVVLQFIDSYLMSEKDQRIQERDWRDYYMASNFMDMIEHEKPGTKAVIWAHNGHISHNDAEFSNPFGSYLKKAYGDKYYALGFVFNKGSFRAIEFSTSGEFLGLQEFTVLPAKEMSLDWYLAQINQPIFILNYRNSSSPDFIRNFLNDPIDTREFGSVTDRSTLHLVYSNIKLSTSYDGIIFINETTRSRPTEKGIGQGK